MRLQQWAISALILLGQALEPASRVMRRWFVPAALIFFVLIAALSISRPTWAIPFTDIERGHDDTPLGLTLGLDLQGGVHLVYETQDPNPSPEQLEGVVQIIRTRVDQFGVAEPLIQTLGVNRIVVQLPGVQDVQAAKDLIGSPAVLDFRELIPVPIDPTPTSEPADGEATPTTGEAETTPVAGASEDGEATPTSEPVPEFRVEYQIAVATVDGEEVLLTGDRVEPGSSQVTFNPTTGAPEVVFQLDRQGSEAFRQVTGRLIGQPIGIFLDGEAVLTPIVQAEIPQSPRITGLDLQEASILAIQLNAGAFPVPLNKEPILERDVDAFLGADALSRGLRAGLVGLVLVVLFMILYYRMNGVVAATALIIYAIFVLGVFKSMPVVLTLSGLAAFVLSFGLAVDANVLIFERMKEELRTGRSMGSAIDIGFSRAWPAIRDGNFTTLIIAAILFWFGERLGASLVQGFALTLSIGVMLSMFTALVITRRLLMFVTGLGLFRRADLYVSQGVERL